MRDADQAAIAKSLLHGPDHAPAALFAGDGASILRGLRVHANTISHARLVALEDSFPRTRRLLGEAAFNALSRRFIDDGGAQGTGLSAIGLRFPDWLDVATDTLAADLARIEWAWLDSYHAADASALMLSDLAGIDEAALLAIPVRRHPAVQVVRLRSDAAPLVDLAPGTTTVLIARPDVAVAFFAVGDAEAILFDGATDDFAPLRNLIARLDELHPDGGTVIGALIAAGALEKN